LVAESLPSRNFFSGNPNLTEWFQRQSCDPHLHIHQFLPASNAPGFECRRLWIERRQTRSDQISIDESERLSFGWQNVTSEGRFACPLGPAMMMIF